MWNGAYTCKIMGIASKWVQSPQFHQMEDEMGYKLVKPKTIDGKIEYVCGMCGMVSNYTKHLENDMEMFKNIWDEENVGQMMGMGVYSMITINNISKPFVCVECCNNVIESCEIACSMGGIMQYDLFDMDIGWCYGEITTIDGYPMVAWENEWLQPIWVKIGDFNQFWNELDAFWSKMNELYPNGPIW